MKKIILIMSVIIAGFAPVYADKGKEVNQHSQCFISLKILLLQKMQIGNNIRIMQKLLSI